MGMSIMNAARLWACTRLLLGTAAFVGTVACSPGTLPGSPSPVVIGGGGARYNGSITTRRVAGAAYTVTEAAQTLGLSLTVRGINQLSGRFQAGESSGSLQGIVNGSLAGGTFDVTVLISTLARQGSTATTCEGRGELSGTLSGLNVSWTGGTITYDNCPGLSVTSQAQAVAVSPIPGDFGNRANVVITILGSTTITRGTCPGGISGYPFTVEMAERSGIGVTFDSTFVAEERRGFGAASATVLDMPFTDLSGGSRRTYGACSPVAGTYQAFFSGSDANGNRVRVASPIVTFAP
jgi:hypothetical protein